MTNIENNKQEFDSFDDNYEKIFFDTESGGYVVMHKLHGKAERTENIEIAKILCALGKKIVLLPISNQQFTKNPDALVNNEIFEFKVNKTPTFSALDKEIRKAKDQADNILIVVKDKINISMLESAIKWRVDNSVNIKKINVLIRSKVFEFCRKEITNNTFRGKIKKGL